MPTFHLQRASYKSCDDIKGVRVIKDQSGDSEYDRFEVDINTLGDLLDFVDAVNASIIIHKNKSSITIYDAYIE